MMLACCKKLNLAVLALFVGFAAIQKAEGNAGVFTYYETPVSKLLLIVAAQKRCTSYALLLLS